MKNFRLLLIKDVLCLWRAKEELLGTFLFALLLVVVSSFAFREVGYGQVELKSVTPGILWLIFVFSAVLGLNHSFNFEIENRALTGLLIGPVEGITVFAAKFISNVLYILAVQALVIISHTVFFGVQVFHLFPEMMLLTLLGAVGFLSLGTLLSAIAVSTRGRELILPIVLFPLSIPFIAALVSLTRDLLASEVLAFSSVLFIFVCVFDVISLTLAAVLFEYVVKD